MKIKFNERNKMSVERKGPASPGARAGRTFNSF